MESVEEQIKRVGADKAPRITPEHIESQIIAEIYGSAAELGVLKLPNDTTQAAAAITALRCLTICVLVLKNGFTVTGESACASPENFNLEVGKRIARENAVKKIWAMEGYQLRTSLMLGGNA